MDDVARLRKIFDEGPLGVAVLDATYRLVDVNSRFCDMLGYTRDELMALTFPEFTHAEDIGKDVSLAAKLFRGEIPTYEIEKRFIKKNGEIIWGRLHASVVHDDRGEPEFSLGMVEDITEKKKLEEILQAVTSETSGELGTEFFQSLVGQLAIALGTRYAFVGELVGETQDRVRTVAVWAAGEPGENFEYDLAGTPCENVVSKTMCLYPSGVQEQFPEDQLLADMNVASYLGTPLSGPSGEAVGLLVVMHDEPMTEAGLFESVLAIFAARAGAELERKRTEEKLQASEERFRRLSEGAIEGTAITDQGIILDANPQFARLYGYELSEIIGAKVSSLVAPEARELVSKHIAAGDNQPYENLGLRKDGTTFPVQAHGKAIEYEGRTVRVTNIRDITERTRADEALRESEEQHRSLIESSQDGILAYDTDFRYTMWNPMMEKISGLKRERVIGRNAFEVFPFINDSPEGEAYRQAIEGKRGFVPESSFSVPENGKEGYFESLHFPLRDARSSTVGGIGIVRDITERREMMAALQNSEEKYRTLTELSPVQILIIQDSRIAFANPAIERGTGYSAAELKGMDFLKLLPQEEQEEARRRLEQCLDGNAPPQTWRHRIQSKTGQEGWADSTFGLGQFDGGPAAIVVSRGVTSRVLIEKALAESEEKFRTVTELSPAPILVIQDSKVVFANPAMENFSGHSVSQLRQLDFGDLFPPEDRKEAIERVERCLAGEDGVWRHGAVSRDGTTGIWDSMYSLSEFDGGPAVIVVAMDSTEQAAAEQALKESEEQFRSLTELSPARIMVFQDEKVVFANSEMVKGSEYSAAELCELNFQDLMPPEERDAAKRRLAACLDGSEPRQTIRHRTITKSGIAGWAETMMGRVQFAGRPAVIAVATDVTEQMRIEQALSESEERFRSIAETAPAAITILQGTTVRYASPGVETLTGYSPEEVEAMDLTLLIHPDDMADDMDVWADRAARRAAGEVNGGPARFRVLRKDGGERWCESSATRIDFQGEPAILGIALDVTGRVRAEEALSESEEKWRSLVENTPDFVFLVGPDEKIQYANRVSPGLQMEDVIGTSVFEFIVPEYHDFARSAMARVFESRTTETFENEVAVPPGSESWFLNQLSPIIVGDEVVSIAYISTDITKMKRVEEELRQTQGRLVHLANTAPAAVTVIQGTAIRYANVAFETMTGYSTQDLDGLEATAIVHTEDRDAFIERMAKRLAGEEIADPVRFRMIRKDGEERWAETSATVIDFEGAPAVFAVTFDITDRVRAEEELAESQERVKELVETVPHGIEEIDRSGVFVFANKAAHRQIEYEEGDLVGTSVFDLIIDAEKDSARAYLKEVIEEEPPLTPYFGQRRTKTGRIIDVEVAWNYKRDAEGKVIGFISVVTDLTLRRQAEEEARKSQERFQRLVETAGAGIMIVASQGKIKYANPAIETMTGRTLAELQALEVSDIVHPEDSGGVQGRIDRRLQGEEITEPSRQRIVAANGDEHWVEASATLIDYEGEPAVLGVLLDITDRVRAEEELGKSEERFQKLVETAGAGILIVASQGKIKYANPAIEALTGRTLAELQALEVSDIVHPEDSGGVQDGINRRLRGEEFTEPSRRRIVAANGDERWVEGSATLIDYEGEPAVLGILVDITDRVRAEKALKASEVRFREMAETARAGILIVAGSTITYANPAGEALLGRSLEELQAIDFWEVAHPDDRKALVEHFDGHESAGQRSVPFAYRVIKPDGEERWVEASVAMTSFQGEDAGAVVLLDVTERVLAEQATQLAREELEGKVERQMLRKNPYELTFRELTVLHHVTAGEADKEIAAELGISPLTAQNHVASILRKMDATSRTNAGVRAVREGLID